jgi:ubiquitin carboxyl-terminal hydrolase 30
VVILFTLSHYQGNTDVASSLSSVSRSKLYGLTTVVEHYGVPGVVHYAVYMRVASNLESSDPGQPLLGLGRTWFYISDGDVLQVLEDDVLGADATLLFYERL